MSEEKLDRESGLRALLDCMVGKYAVDIPEVTKEEVCAANQKDACENPIVVNAIVQCSKMQNANAKTFISADLSTCNERNGETGIRDIDITMMPNTFGMCRELQGICHPEIEEARWQGCDEGSTINGRPGVTMFSYMICTNGGGMITPVTDGQKVSEGKTCGATTISENYIDFLIAYEAGSGDKWQYAQDLGDGVITIAFGVVLKQRDGSYPLTKPVYDYYMKKSEDGIPLTRQEAYELTQIRLEDYIEKVNEKANEKEWDLSENQFDALVDMAWNLGETSLGYVAAELLATGDLGDAETKRRLEKEILETAHYTDSNGVGWWSKNLAERRLDVIRIAEGGEDAYTRNEFTAEWWNQNARDFLIQKGISENIIKIYKIQIVNY